MLLFCCWTTLVPAERLEGCGLEETQRGDKTVARGEAVEVIRWV
jgi:hypothetical protein